MVPLDTIRGQITDIRGASLLTFESISIFDDTGREWTFYSDGKRFSDFTPSHIREHMLSGASVEISFHRENAYLVIDGIRD
jgi:hypothetical protein